MLSEMWKTVEEVKSGILWKEGTVDNCGERATYIGWHHHHPFRRPHVHWLAPPPPLQTPSRTLAGTTTIPPYPHVYWVALDMDRCCTCARVYHGLRSVPTPARTLGGTGHGSVLHLCSGPRVHSALGERRALPRRRYSLPALDSSHWHLVPALDSSHWHLVLALDSSHWHLVPALDSSH